MVKSRDQKKGVLSPVRAVWDWFWAPRKNPHAAEERANQRRRDKRKKTAPVVAKAKPKAVAATVDQTDLAFVDKSGNVRLSDGGRIVARAAKGSKAAALAAATALYNQRLAELDRLEAELETSASSLATFEDDLAQLKNDLRDQPGLGDLEALDLRFAALEAALAEKTQAQWQNKREIISDLEALATAQPAGLAEKIDDLTQTWATAGSAGSVHDTVLEKRYAAALEAASRRLKIVTDHPDVLEDERQAVMDDLIDLMASEDRDNADAQLAALKDAWRQAGGNENQSANEQFQAMTAAIEQDAASLAAEAETLRQSIEAETGALDQAFTKLSRDTNAIADGGELRSLGRKVADLENRGGHENRDLTSALRRRLDELQWRADREIEKRKGQVAGLVDDARKHLGEAEKIPANIATLKEWRVVEDGAKAGLEQAEKAVGSLKDLGRVARNEVEGLSNDLRGARKALNEARKSFFETLDENRETIGYKKRALLDRLSFPPVGASTKELDQHVDAVMADWKAAGSAGRDQDQALWEEFQEIRGRLRGLREEASAAEREDYGARLADAFTRKRELSYTIEDEIRMGRLVLEKQKDPKFEKELRRKERRLEDLRKDLSDIQRKLGKISKSKAERSPEQASAEEVTQNEAAGTSENAS